MIRLLDNRFLFYNRKYGYRRRKKIAVSQDIELSNINDLDSINRDRFCDPIIDFQLKGKNCDKCEFYKKCKEYTQIDENKWSKRFRKLTDYAFYSLIFASFIGLSRAGIDYLADEEILTLSQSTSINQLIVYLGFGILAVAYQSLNTEKKISSLEKRIKNLEVLNNKPQFTIQEEKQVSVIPFYFKQSAKPENRKKIERKEIIDKKATFFKIVFYGAFVSFTLFLISGILSIILKDILVVVTYLLYFVIGFLSVAYILLFLVEPLVLKFYYKLPFKILRRFSSDDENRLIVFNRIRNPDYIPNK